MEVHIFGRSGSGETFTLWVTATDEELRASPLLVDVSEFVCLDSDLDAALRDTTEPYRTVYVYWRASKEEQHKRQIRVLELMDDDHVVHLVKTITVS